MYIKKLPQATNRPLVQMGAVRITSLNPKFNGSHFGLPPSSIQRLTGLGGKFPCTMTYAHGPHFGDCQFHGSIFRRKFTSTLLSVFTIEHWFCLEEHPLCKSHSFTPLSFPLRPTSSLTHSYDHERPQNTKRSTYYPGQKKRPLPLCIKSEHCSYHGISKNQAWLRFGVQRCAKSRPVVPLCQSPDHADIAW